MIISQERLATLLEAAFTKGNEYQHDATKSKEDQATAFYNVSREHCMTVAQAEAAKTRRR